MAAQMTWEEARDRLRQMRDEQQRHSEEVLEIWEDVMVDFCHKIGDEVWLVYEQVSIAACDCGQMELSQMCIEAMRAQFPDSLRVRKLQAMRLEALDMYERAETEYRAIIEEDPTNALVRKRLIAVYKSQNKIPEAIKELSTYLKQFMSDYEAWLELSDLYLAELEYAKAAFCIEELLLSNPHNHLYHQRYAEIRYSQGDYENMEQARSYFSHASRLSPSNMRALFGLFLSASNIASSQKSNAKIKKDNMKYAAWAADQISQRYQSKLQKKEEGQQLQAIEGMLDALQLQPTS